MKELIIVRHAKSDWGDPSLSDHDRPLNSRGERDAPRMGRLLADRLEREGKRIDAIVSSTALRAKTTALIFARELGMGDEQVKLERDGYHASSREWMHLLAGIDESRERVAIFGHNPGLHILVDDLVGTGSGMDHLPTCAVVRIALRCEFWGGIDRGEGEFIECLKPKEDLA